METKSLRKFNTNFRKKLVEKLNKIKNKDDYITIYNIILEDIGTNFSSNVNGIFVNMNLLSDKGITNLVEFVDKKTNINNNNNKIVYKSYKFDEVDSITEIGHKLSNQDKTIIKKIRNNVLIE